MSPRALPLLLLGLLAGCPKITRPTKADALDRITGTEGWRRAPENISQEWKEWYRARVARRREHREMRVQQVRNARLTDLMDRYPDGPGMEEMQHILRSRATRMPRGAGTPGVAPDGADGPGGPASRDHGREPPPWIKVPVERLDQKGQAVDDEGDREMDRVFKRKQR